MNQKQRDLLCSMLRKEAAKISEELDSEFLPDKVDRYSRTDHISLYEAKGMTIENMKGISGELLRQFKTLKSKETGLRKQEKALDDKWSQFTDQLMEAKRTQLYQKSMAKCALAKAVDSAIIEIQFAEDAEEAKKILASLPGVAELMAGLQDEE